MSNKSTKPLLKIPHYEQELNNSCMPACIRMVLAFHGIKKSEQDIRKLVKVKPAGVNPINVIQLKDWGLNTTISFSSFDELKELLNQKIPPIVILWTGELDHWDSEKYFDYLHAVVAIGSDENNIWINDPAFFEYPTKIPINQFLDAWSYSQHILILIEKQ